MIIMKKREKISCRKIRYTKRKRRYKLLHKEGREQARELYPNRGELNKRQCKKFSKIAFSEEYFYDT